MERPKFKWCREVIEQVRFKPDRDRVWDELIAHIEDRVEELKDRGCTEEEAEARAVASMGDPVEVGKQLDAVHKPWLGRLWMFSKVLVILTLVVSLLLAYPAVERYRDQVENDAVEMNTVEYWTESASLVSRHMVDKEMEIDGYRFTVDEVSWWKKGEIVRLVICVTTRRSLFLPELDRYSQFGGAMEQFYIVDDRGNRDVSWDENSALPHRRVCYFDPSKVGRPLMGSCIYMYYADNWTPDWVELSYDFQGETYSVRFPGPGGEGA